MRRFLLAGLLAAAGCSGSSSGVPTPAVVGTAYDIQKLLVRGSVTLIDFGAKW